jgi:hypothetical protein
MKCRFCVFILFIGFHSYSQTQTCPANINYATGDLTHWYAYTGNNKAGNGTGAIDVVYDSTRTAPSGTIGNKSIAEYNLPGVKGIKVITQSTNDQFGGFPTIPTINGYRYNYSILLGSTSITRGNADGSGGGGYIRGVSYSFNVPAGSPTVPYTMTYAYAMVLENGTHISLQQPVITATLRTPAGVIACASPSYYLPTFNNVTEGGRGATLDSATAKRNGFSLSNIRTPNASPPTGAQNSGNEYLQDVWTKGWTEVTFDLSAYRGQQVSLTFEADNCIPGGHFAYAYIAIRNSCAGLMISGDSLVCNNSAVTYSVPALAGATYQWNIPASWTVISPDTGSIIHVKSSDLGGAIIVREKNSCADLVDTIRVNTLPSPVGGKLDGTNTVCEGENSTTLNLTNYSGLIESWLSSTDNKTWNVLPYTNPQLVVENLDASTYFAVQVGKGSVCPADTSSSASIVVDQKSVGGQINPAEATLCADQIAGETLILARFRGNIQRWQYSTDDVNWFDVQPGNPAPTFTVKGITSNTEFRAIDKNGVCPIDTSAIANIIFDPVKYPKAVTEPDDTTICFGTTATLNASIEIGTSYSWTPVSAGGGSAVNAPFLFTNQVNPVNSTDYVLTVMNDGCPNAFLDTSHIEVLAPVIVEAGRDTSVVVGEPLQFEASSSDPGPDTFSWTPATELNDPSIADPLATYTEFDNVIKYMVKAVTPFGCSGEGFITVKVFKSKPDIFVPNAFTPGLTMNSVFRPIPVGVSTLEYFRVYNRLGQLVFNTSTIGKGWDGLLNGTPQSAGGYVWMVKGTDYTGNIIAKKGTMVLIR